MTRKARPRTRVPILGISSLLLVSVLAGCSAWTSPPAPVSQPYFTADQKDIKSFQSFAKKQEALIATCSESNSCEQVYFTRALLGLYESREVAEKYFEKVVVVAPKSQSAVSSKAWLELLRKPPGPGSKSRSQAVLAAPTLAETNTSLALTADRLVRDLLAKETVIQQLRASKDENSETVETLQRELTDRDHKIESLQSKKDAAKPPADPVSIQNMQKQLAERDRKIEELSTQLDALKRIDQEMREKVRPIRPPLTTVPVPGPEVTP